MGYTKRTTITTGDHEPTDAEAEWPSDSEDEDEGLSEEVKEKAKFDEANKNEDVKGIPSFWLTIFKNVEMLAEMVQEADEPVLESLTDITVTFSEKDPMGFTLHFHFAPNQFFTNSVLTKCYEMKCEPPEDDPFSFEGPEIFKCTGCPIDWQKGKNLTVKQVKKKQKHKSKGSVRTITKQVKADSFFNFFDPPAVPDDPNAEVDEDTQALLTADFEIGHYIRERIVPRAVLFFTGGLGGRERRRGGGVRRGRGRRQRQRRGLRPEQGAGQPRVQAAVETKSSVVPPLSIHRIGQSCRHTASGISPC